MKTRKSTRSLLALVLILSMLLSCAGFTAFAQVTTPVNVEASGDGNEKEETVADDIQVTDPADISAVTVKADTGAEAELEVQGNISAESTGGDATAAEIAATDGGKAEFEVQGDVEATAPNGEATGIGAEALIGGASAEISVTGNVTATGDQAVGIEDRIDTKASLDISVDGDVKAVGDSSAIGVGLPIFALCGRKYGSLGQGGSGCLYSGNHQGHRSGSHGGGRFRGHHCRRRCEGSG